MYIDLTLPKSAEIEKRGFSGGLIFCSLASNIELMHGFFVSLVSGGMSSYPNNHKGYTLRIKRGSITISILCFDDSPMYEEIRRARTEEYKTQAETLFHIAFKAFLEYMQHDVSALITLLTESYQCGFDDGKEDFRHSMCTLLGVP